MLALLLPAFAADAVPEPRFGPLDRPARGVGLGLVAGYPLRLSVSYKKDGPVWFEGGVGWPYGAAVEADANVLLTVVELPIDNVPDTHYPVWLGAGARLRVVPGYAPYAFDWGLRVPVGVGVEHDRLPIEVFAEVVPIISLWPVPYGAVEGGVGARFYFDSVQRLP